MGFHNFMMEGECYFLADDSYLVSLVVTLRHQGNWGKSSGTAIMELAIPPKNLCLHTCLRGQLIDGIVEVVTEPLRAARIRFGAGESRRQRVTFPASVELWRSIAAVERTGSGAGPGNRRAPSQHHSRRQGSDRSTPARIVVGSLRYCFARPVDGQGTAAALSDLPSEGRTAAGRSVDPDLQRKK